MKKILPQCQYTQYWYDHGDKVIFMQDANLRTKNKYRFLLYDRLRRLCVQGLCDSFDHSVNVSNGNIEYLQRRGRKQDGHVGKIDNLSIFHHGNQLSSVVDDAAKIYYAGIFNFNGDGKNEAHYKYNDSGSLTEDTGRGITNIEYDDWNNPKRIQFANGNVTKYVYSADGEKLRTVHYTAAPNITVTAGQTHELSKDEILSIDSTDYIGRLVLKNGKPDMYTFTGGYYAFAGTYPSLGTVGGLYFYNYDHLGNVREVVNEDGKLLQVNNYYPFGAPYSDNSVTAKNPGLQPYKYCGKELDLVHGLNTYDHGARQNYSILGVWDRVDPMAEKSYNISPYAVCGNNPLSLVDFDGNDNYQLDSMGNIIYLGPTDDNFHVIYSSDKNGSINPASSIHISKQMLDNKLVTKHSGVSSKEFGSVTSDYNINIYTSNDENEAKTFFEFVSKNSLVEWSYVESKKSTMVGTSNSIGDNATLPYSLNFYIGNKEDVINAIHSHNLGNTNPSPGDLNIVREYYSQLPNTKYYIFDGATYKEYDLKTKSGDNLDEVIVIGHRR